MSHRTVIMTPENFSRAIDLARAASDCTGYGTATPAAIATLLEETASQGDILWTHDAGEFAVAITGGPTSKANAAFLVDARAIVLGMVDRIDELETRLRNADAESKRLAVALETIRTNTRCPDPNEGGCIPSDGCAHEVASSALKKRRDVR